MNTILLVMIVYFAAMLYIGAVARRHVGTSADFLIAGHKLGILVTTLAHQAAAMSGWMFLAWAGQVARMGLGALYTAISAGTAPITNFAILPGACGRSAVRWRHAASSTCWSRATTTRRARRCASCRPSSWWYSDHLRRIADHGSRHHLPVRAGLGLQAVRGAGGGCGDRLTSAGGMLAVAWTDFVQGRADDRCRRHGDASFR